MKEKIHKDFHGALSVGFEFLDKNYGKKAVEEYLKQVAENVYGWLIKKIKKNGLSELERYWSEIFSEEEGEFEIKRKDNEEIVLKVKKCPAISHMKEKGYPVYSDFCIQCKVINEFIGEKTGYNSEIHYDKKGRCEQKLREK
mgnify:CR=1 FL=1